MKMHLALAGALAVGLMATGATAQDRSIGEDSAWRFQTANDRVARQNGLNQYELNRAGYFDQIRNGNTAALAGAGGVQSLGGLMQHNEGTAQISNTLISNGNFGSLAASATSIGNALSVARP